MLVVYSSFCTRQHVSATVIFLGVAWCTTTDDSRFRSSQSDVDSTPHCVLSRVRTPRVAIVWVSVDGGERRHVVQGRVRCRLRYHADARTC